MKKYSILSISALAMQVAVAQFAPPAGQPGTTAMHKDSSAFVAWAGSCKIIRGFQNVSDPSLGYATIGDSTSAIGKPDGSKIVSLGDGGIAIVTFKQPIMNGPGNDFAVFENSFSDTFLELGFVEVSSDGTNYFRFPATSNTQDSVQLGNDAEMDARKLNNLAGKYRALYGTPFDLQELSGTTGLDMNNITHVKITDVTGCLQQAYASTDMNGKKINDPWPTPFASCGFDLDGVGVIHQAASSVEEETAFIQLRVFPNPLTPSGKIQLILNTDQPGTIDLIDLTGRPVTVFATKAVPRKLHLFSTEGLWLTTGLYLLRVNSGNIIKTEKIIVVNE